MTYWQVIAATGLLATTPLSAQEAAAAGDKEAQAPQTVNEVDVDPARAARLAEIEATRVEAQGLRRLGRNADAAVALGRLITLLGSEFGNDGAELIDPLLTSADLLAASSNLPASAESFERAISIIEITDSVFSYDLIEPLSAVAAVYNASRRPDQAVESLRRARHITHRRLGILNMEQLDLAEQLAESYVRLGQVGEANRENRFAFRVNERQYGPDSPELVPALNKLSEWYERIGFFSVARRHYRRAVELLEQSYGPDDLRVADELRRIARTYINDYEPLREGEVTLSRAIAIYEGNPQTDTADHGASLIELGDWLMLARRRDQAMVKYRLAWDLLTEDGAKPGKADGLLGQPKGLRFPHVLTDESSLRGASQVFIDATFTVTRRGVVRDVDVFGGNAHWTLKRSFATAITREARFRPRFVDGEPMLTEKVQFRYSWVVRGEEVDRSVESVDRSGDQELP